MANIFFNVLESDKGMNYRWVQPPQVVYLVNTVDRLGNHNITPVTLGTCVGVNSFSNPDSSNYYYAFSVGNVDVPEIPALARHAFHNLEETGECVISYPGAELMEKVWAAALPYPAGIEEMSISRLTPLPSRMVKPAGIADCLINLEARVQSSCAVGQHFRLYICQIVGVSVKEELVEQDNQDALHRGVLAIDPFFEVSIVPKGNLPPRMYFGRMDQQRFTRTPDDMGSSRMWMGTFEAWMEDEYQRGKMNTAEFEEIMRLHDRWKENPDPQNNRDVKQKISAFLEALVWDRRGKIA